MNIESEIFLKSKVIYEKLGNYGFVKEKEYYKYEQKFLDNSFKATIIIDLNGVVKGNIYDLDSNAEYTSFRIINNNGKYVSTIRESYKDILLDIKKNCFESKYFVFSQSNRIVNYLKNKYDNLPEFLWKDQKDGVFRNTKNNKWYAIIMYVDKSKITKDSGKVEVINLKAKEDEIPLLIKKDNYYKAYHMNKKNWYTIILDEKVNDTEIFELIDESYNLINSKK